jgi:hypothetical protein
MWNGLPGMSIECPNMQVQASMASSSSGSEDWTKY